MDGIKNISTEFICDKCNYNGKNIQSYERHLKSKKHRLAIKDENYASNVKLFVCHECNYKTPYKYNYTNHLKCDKHKNNINPDNNKFICECGRKYKHKYSLTKHQKKCDTFLKLKNLNINNIDIKDNESLVNVINNLIQQNTQLINKNHEMSENNQKLTDQMQEQLNSVVEMAKQPKVVNNTLNILNYLNTKCTKAKNFDESLKTVIYTIQDMDEFLEIGWYNSCVKKVNELLNVEQEERPIHCSDAKRKQFYVKNNDVWSKCDGEDVNNKVIYTLKQTQLETAMKWKFINAEKIKKSEKKFDDSMRLNMEIIEILTKEGATNRKKMMKYLSSFNFDKNRIRNMG